MTATFPQGRYGTVSPSNPRKSLPAELKMLGRLIGTDHPTGRAEARGIVERAEDDVSALLAALKWAIGMAEEAIMVRESGDDPEDTEEVLQMHRDEMASAQAAIARAEGHPL